MVDAIKHKTETQEFIEKCRELFHMLGAGKITAKQLEEELEKMNEKPLFSHSREKE